MFQKYCVVFQELFVVFADMGHRSFSNLALETKIIKEENDTRRAVDGPVLIKTKIPTFYLNSFATKGDL